MIRTKLFILSALLVASGILRAQDVPNPDPEIERRSFKIADGWEIKLFATDPMVEKPISMNWDAKGRLWCATSETYPQVKPGQVPNDKIYILEDTQGVGVANRSTIWAQGLFLPTSVAPGDGGAYVTNSTEILYLKDSKGTGKADTRRVVLSGFGTEDTHHIIHTFRWGPDGRLYFIQSIYIHSHVETPNGIKHLLASGVWRFDPRTMDLDVYSRGLINPWGIVWNDWGQTFQTDGAGGEGINYAFPGIGFTSAVGLDRIMPGMNPGSPKYCGEEILSGRGIPDDYRGDILTNDFRANRIVRFKVKESGAGFTDKQMPDFLTSTDQAFRPVDIKMGPDGAIYIADWYNPIIQHGEVDFRDPRRDHTHGRIWRVTAKDRPPVERPKLDGASVQDLLNYLKSPEQLTRMQTKLVLRERDPQEVIQALRQWVRKLRSSEPNGERDRVEALWTCQTLNVVEPELLQRVLKSDDPHARSAGVRVAGYWADKLDEPLALISPFVADENPHVRLEAVRALAQVASPQAVVLAARVLDKPMDPFLDYALWLTCNELKETWLPALQAGKLTGWESADQLNYALKAVKSPEAVKSLVAQLKSGQTPQAARGGVIDLIADIGGADEANVLLEMATSNELKDRATQHHLLDALLKLARRQHVTPNDPARVKGLLSSEDPAVRGTALRLAAAWKLEDLRPQICRAAEESDSPPPVRRSAMQALADLGGPASLETLRKLSESPDPPATREAAIAALASLDVKDAARRAAGFLADHGTDPAPLINALLDREGGAAALAEALRTHKLPPDAAKLSLRAVRNAGKEAPALSDVLTQLTGASSEPVRLSPEQMKQTIAEVQQKGDAARGEEVFRRAETGCYQCHSIAGAGGWLAPDISSIGASSPGDYIIESILDPNKAIKDGYQGYTVVTKSGEIYSGIKVRQDNNQIVLRDNTHYEIPIPIADVKQQKDAGSLMPNGLAATITHQEFIDLVRFLSELGKPGPYGPTNAQYVRTWKVMTPVPEALTDQSPENVSMSEVDRQAWNPTYSLVSGVLPVDALSPAKGKPVAYARGEMNVTAAGKMRLVLNSPKGLSLWTDGKPTKAGQQINLDLPAGMHALLFRIDLAERGNEGLRVEVADAPGSSGHAQPVNGK